jgi:predicted O-linked N-acetylglucosamine transferase (SPINDLY family)
VQSDGLLDARVIYLLRLMARQAACDWRRRDELVQAFGALTREASESGRPIEAPELLFWSLSVPVDTAERMSLAQGVAGGFERRAASIESRPSPRDNDVPIRIGYVSPDFRAHAVGILIQDLLRAHDRSRFQVFAYSLAPDDGSDVRRKIMSGVDTFRDFSSLSDDAIAQRIADDGIDVLVDLAGYTDFGRSGVFARRPAGVQVNYLGYAGTLGAGYIDYAIVDSVACPAGSEQQWTEKLVRLPTVFSPSGSAEIPTHPARQRADVGLPVSGFVFCCFANNYKIDPSIFDVWMRIQRRVPNACLWLTLSHPEVEANLKREAQVRGVEPERVVFAARESLPAYLARYRLADLFLDTRWFNAHTTAIDALRCGVPVLTLAGETMSSRLGASVLTAAGLSELITGSTEEYEARAVELASNSDLLRGLRDTLWTSVRDSALFDTPARARELEAAYIEMVSRRRRGLPPASFMVNARPAKPAWF